MENDSFIDVDQYISDIIKILDLKIVEYDKLAVSLDLKDYIYTQANFLSENEKLKMNDAVLGIVQDMGSPKEFADKFIKGLADEKRYLLLKVILAIFLAVFPLILFIIILIA